MNKDNVSVLITSRKGDPIRDRNLAWIVKRYKALFPKYELVLEIDDKHTPLFAKAAAMNRAFKRSKGAVVLQSDAEVFCVPVQIRDAVQACDISGWASCYTYMYKLKRLTSGRLLSAPVDGLPDLSHERIEIYKPGYSVGPLVESPSLTYRRDYSLPNAATGYLTAVRRDVWVDYDERFVGWGYEDSAWDLAMKTLAGQPYRVKGALYHLWHPLTTRLQARQSGALKRNRRLYLQYKAARGDKEAIRALLREGQP